MDHGNNKVTWLKLIYNQKHESWEVWCEQGVYIIKLKSPEIEVMNDSSKYLDGNQNVDITVKVWRKKECLGSNDGSSNSKNVFWCNLFGYTA